MKRQFDFFFIRSCLRMANATRTQFAILALGLVAGATPSLAATFHVRAGATGANNGSDWNNAWTSPSNINFAAVNPGDTIYIAAGTYGNFGIPKSGAAGSPITFKRATVGSHGSDTGWSASYDNRVILDGGGGLSVIGIGEAGAWGERNHFTIDGVTKYGIWIRNAQYGVRCGYGCNGLTLRNLEIGDPGAYKMGEDGVQGSGSDLLIEHSYIHDNDNSATHGDGIQWFRGDRVTLRYNIWKNNGQQIYLGEGSWDDVVNDVNVYYNVIYNRGGSHYNGIVLYGNSTQTGRYYNFYNNTFDLEARDNSGFNSVFYPLRGTATFNFKNNAVVYSNASQVANIPNRSNNAYDNSGSYLTWYIPTEANRVTAADLGFVNIEAANYRLASTSPLIGKGVNVGLTRDFDGNPVPATPSIGAFEVAGAAPAPTLPAPTNLRVVSVTSAQVQMAYDYSATSQSGFVVSRKEGSGAYVDLSASLVAADRSFSDLNVKPSTAYCYQVRAIDSGSSTSSSKSNEMCATTLASTSPTPAPTPAPTPVPPSTTSQSLLGSMAPATSNNDDGVSYELGMRFKSNVAGKITAIRFFKGSLESGTHTGKIYSASGTLLASVVFTGETASGWQTMKLSAPLSIKAETEYVVSVNTGNRLYVATVNGFASQIRSGNLRSVIGSNGVYGPIGRKPTSSWNQSNYFRDVVFTPN